MAPTDFRRPLSSASPRYLTALSLATALLAAAPGYAASTVAPPPAAKAPAHGSVPTAKQLSHNEPNGPLAGEPIARVELVGNNSANRTLILNQIRVTPGEDYSRAQVDVDVRSIASLGKFSSVRADIIPMANHQVIVRYVVKERGTINSVVIKGNRHVRDRTLRRLVLARVGGAEDPFIFRTDIKAIRRIYHDRGFQFCSVVLDKKLLASGTVEYNIVEGPRTYISNVNFVGNNLYPDWYLHFKLETKSRWKLFWLIPIRQGVLSHSDINSDLGELRRLWIKKGYLDCRTSYILQYKPDFSRVIVQFIIHSGVRYRIGSVAVKGNHAFPTTALLPKIKMQTGMYYDQSLIQAGQKILADDYGKAGYVYSKVTPTYAFSARPGIVNLTFNVMEGKSFRVGQIIIRGNADVQDHVARRAIRLYPGHLYDTVAVRRSVKHLQDLGLFSHASITPIGHKPDNRDALVNLDQGQTGRFLIGAGVSTDAGLIGQISLSQRNFDIGAPPHSLGEFLRGQSFKGNGQYFQILLEPGTVYQLYKVTFAEPYLWDSPYSFRNSAYYFTEAYNSYNLNRLGDRITFGRRITNHLSVSLTLRGEEVNVNSIINFGPTDVAAPEIVAQQGTHPLTSVTPGIEFNNTDSAIFPSHGIDVGASWEQYGALGGQYDFSKINASFTYYRTLYRDLFNRKTIFMFRSQLGFIPLGNSVFFERFYAGGIGSLRGFTYEGVTPRSGVLLDGVGGNFMTVSTAEINTPIYENILRGVVFIDAGDVEPNVHLGIIRIDAGVGVRVIIPFLGRLPLGIDLAYPIQRGHNDHVEYISFAFGLPM